MIVLAFIVAAMILFAAIFLGSVHTLWMFLNSMQLVLYTALLQVSLPPDSCYFMTRLLNVLRLNLRTLETSYDVQGRVFESTLNESTFNASVL